MTGSAAVLSLIFRSFQFQKSQLQGRQAIPTCAKVIITVETVTFIIRASVGSISVLLCFIRMILRLRAPCMFSLNGCSARGQFYNVNRADDACFVHVFGINGCGAILSDGGRCTDLLGESC